MYQKILEKMISAGKEASEMVMKIYRKGFNINIKEDKSPVTDADLASNKILRESLKDIPDIAWLSEEDYDDLSRMNKKRVFVIDPLDGTEDFVKRDDSFSINIALVENNLPVISLIMVPAMNTYAYAIKGKGSYYFKDGTITKMHVSDRTNDLILVESKTHLLKEEQEVLDRHKNIIKDVIYLGASTKAIALANGDVDASIRYTPNTKEWDTCAADLLVKEAGGIFLDTNLKEFTYNRKDVYNRNGYCMFNKIENEVLLK